MVTGKSCKPACCKARMAAYGVRGARGSGAWVKVKHHRHQRFVIGGWIQRENTPAPAVGALLLGYYRDRPGGKRLYALTGHGEPEVSDLESATGLGELAAALKEDNVEIRPLLLATAASVPEDAGGKIQILSVDRILADTIHNVFCDESVSEIFAGENQLF